MGIVAAITPFNDPLNLVAHKLGPALIGGNGVVLKPGAHAADRAGLGRAPAGSRCAVGAARCDLRRPGCLRSAGDGSAG